MPCEDKFSRFLTNLTYAISLAAIITVALAFTARKLLKEVKFISSIFLCRHSHSSKNFIIAHTHPRQAAAFEDHLANEFSRFGFSDRIFSPTQRQALPELFML